MVTGIIVTTISAFGLMPGVKLRWLDLSQSPNKKINLRAYGAGQPKRRLPVI